MTWLTEEQLIYLHDELIRATGGSQGLRDKNLLQSALYSPLQTFDSSELFPTIQQKATRLACGLTQNHLGELHVIRSRLDVTELSRRLEHSDKLFGITITEHSQAHHKYPLVLCFTLKYSLAVIQF